MAAGRAVSLDLVVAIAKVVLLGDASSEVFVDARSVVKVVVSGITHVIIAVAAVGTVTSVSAESPISTLSTVHSIIAAVAAVTTVQTSIATATTEAQASVAHWSEQRANEPARPDSATAELSVGLSQVEALLLFFSVHFFLDLIEDIIYVKIRSNFKKPSFQDQQLEVVLDLLHFVVIEGAEHFADAGARVLKGQVANDAVLLVLEHLIEVIIFIEGRSGNFIDLSALLLLHGESQCHGCECR